MQAADGGTLFLDEVAETLDAAVQPKLLRVLEQHEVVSLGASHPRKVDVRICAATLKDLRAEVNAGRFREDLHYRIGQPRGCALPSLARAARGHALARRARALSRVDARLTLPHPSLIEACALRPWPGNVRSELLGEIRRARPRRARRRPPHGGEGPRPAPSLAGREMGTDARRTTSSGPGSAAVEVTREAIDGRAAGRAGERDAGGAGALGMHRNQLRRWITKNAIDPKGSVRRGGIDDDATGEGGSGVRGNLPED